MAVVLLVSVIHVATPQASAAAPETTTAVAARVRGRAVPWASRRGKAEVDLCTGSVMSVVVVAVLLLPKAQAQGLPAVKEVLHAAITGSGHALLPSAERRQRCRWLGEAPAVVAMDRRFWPLCGRQRLPGAGRTWERECYREIGVELGNGGSAANRVDKLTR